VRIDEGGFVNYYTVQKAAPWAELTATSVASAQTAAQNATTLIYLTAHTDWETGQLVVAGVSTNVLEVQSVSTSTTDVYVVQVDTALSAGSPNTVTDLKLTVATTNLRVNDYVSLGPTSAPGYDVYQITATGTDAATGVTKLNLTQKNAGSNQRSPGATAIAKGAVVSLQPYVNLKEFNVGPVSISASTSITEKYGVQLKTEALSGRRTAAGTVPTAQALLTVDANEAGSVLVVGADDNGPIWTVLTLGDYAVVLKNRSIQVLQYVGRLSGVFHLRTEVRNEGLIARNAYKQLNSDRMVFLGNRELYLYRGGQSPQPICMQYTRQLYKELDRTRLNEIILLHKEPRNEVWVVYPVVGGQKVLVWNYVEDNTTIDEYPVALGTLTALAQCRWETDPTWDDFSDQSWDQISDTTIWDSFVGMGDELVSIVCTNDASLLVHGRVFNRNGAAYEASAETMDYDFEDASLLKYVEAVQLSLQILVPEGQTRRLYVQVGTKLDADDTITWSARQTVYVQGDGQAMTKVNVSQGGRFVRLRFISDEADVAWRVSGYTIFARRGGTY
jgi:hypothetical protein